jgi:DNA repair exonuclease SbcCD ATPase subunit
MNTKYNKINLLIAGLVLAVFVAAPVFAQTTGTIQKDTTAQASNLKTLISRADTQIDQRIKSLNNLIGRMGEMKKISATDKTSLNSSVQNVIDELNALKIKIDAETNIQTARVDYQSTTKSYRVYALVMPQISIMAASDRILTIVDSLNALSSKIQSRFASLTVANADPINQTLSDLKAEISDASVQAKAATSAVATLVPDLGDKTKLAANTAALKDARDKIKKASADIASARSDAGTIAKFLKGLTNSAPAASTNTNTGTPNTTPSGY